MTTKRARARAREEADSSGNDSQKAKAKATAKAKAREEADSSGNDNQKSNGNSSGKGKGKGNCKGYSRFQPARLAVGPSGGRCSMQIGRRKLEWIAVRERMHQSSVRSRRQSVAALPEVTRRIIGSNAPSTRDPRGRRAKVFSS